MLEADTSESAAALAGAGAGAEVDHDVLVEPLVDQDMDKLLEASFLDCTGMKKFNAEIFKKSLNKNELKSIACFFSIAPLILNMM